MLCGEGKEEPKVSRGLHGMIGREGGREGGASHHLVALVRVVLPPEAVEVAADDDGDGCGVGAREARDRLAEEACLVRLEVRPLLAGSRAAQMMRVRKVRRMRKTNNEEGGTKEGSDSSAYGE